VILPVDAPRFTPRARAALAGFVRAHEGPDPVLLVTLDGDGGPSGSSNPGGPDDPPDVELRLVAASILQGHDPGSDTGLTVRTEAPVPVHFAHSVGRALVGHVIDFQDEEGGVRGFLVRTAGPSGSRAPGPPSSSEAPAGPQLVQLAPRRGSGFPDRPVAATSAEPATWAGSGAPGGEASGDGSSGIAASGTEARIRAEIASRVNPLVACHGGEVELVGLRDDGVAEVVMRGGCQGCAAAAGTLADVVSRILMRAVPGLAGVHDVTAHEEGTAPYFARG
jgi:Fe-S cluster biogenesis protein NfuA